MVIHEGGAVGSTCTTDNIYTLYVVDNFANEEWFGEFAWAICGHRRDIYERCDVVLC